MTISVQWQKSSFSGGQGEDCVELAKDGDRLLVRESDFPLSVVMTNRPRVAALIASVKKGNFVSLLDD
jgi:hypothetical protein